MIPVEFRASRVERNSRGLLLINSAGIRFDGQMINPAQLYADRQNWGTVALLTGKNNHRLPDSDETVLRKALCELVPLIIVGRPSGPQLVLRAELRRYPYAANGIEGYEAFAVRLMPDTGEIEHVVLHDNFYQPASHVEENDDRLAFDMSKRVHVELYFQSHDPQTLSPLAPHADFHPVESDSVPYYYY